MIRAGIRRAFRLPLRGRQRWERDVEDEIKLHLTLRAEQLMATGMSSDRAYDEAVRRFGPLTESRARLVDAARHREGRMQRTEYLTDLRQDLAFAARTLRRDIGWTIVTVATLALGIGATTAVFSVVSSLLLHPVPYPDANRVVVVFQQPIKGNNTGINVTIVPVSQVVRTWKTAARSFESLEAVTSEQSELRTTGDPISLNVTRIEPTFPRFAGVAPIVGHMFSTKEVAAHDRVALLGEGMWRQRYGASDSVIGKPITLDDTTYTIIGVLPARLQTPRVGAPQSDVWLPVDLQTDNIGTQLVGRLKPGVDLEAAARDLDSVYSRSTTTGKIPFRAVVTTPARRVSFHDSLVMLGYAVALVLLVACANVAHLLLARASNRRREFAIRAALGAGRGRVFRQLLTECSALSFVGGTLGILLGWVGLKAIVAVKPAALSTLDVARVDGTTLGLALLVTLATSLIFGLLGAAQSAETSTHDALKSGGTAGATAHPRARQLLVVTEMALCATLVVGATMLVHSVINLQNANLGFEPKGLYTLNITAPKGHFPNAASRAQLVRALMTRLGAVPGVRSVSLASTAPSWRSFSIGNLEIEGQPAPTGPATSFIDVNQIGTGYFGTMGIRLIDGTGFTDTTRAAGQVIVNARFARKQWAGASPVGRRIRIAQSHKEPWLTIVGVAADAATGGPSVAESSAPLLYTAAADSDASAILVSTDRSADLLRPVQALTHALDPAATTKVQSVEQMVSESIAVPRFVMVLLTLFAALALLLAAIGLYGVMAYSVAQRTREIGIRVALGAPSVRIARSVVGGGVALAGVGCVAGIAIAFWGTKLIESQLFGVARSDAASFIACIVVLVGTAVVACIVPARRALAVDPMMAIRAD